MQPEVYQRLAEVESRHWWFRARRAIAASVIERLGLAQTAKILEAGCGTGGNLAMLDRFGDVRAFEPDTGARAVASNKGVGPVDPGRLPDGLPEGLADFDMVCAFDVLEHIDDDHGAAVALAYCLKPGGHLVATVPAFTWLWSRHDDAHEHKRRYTRQQLKALLKGAGLEVERCSYFNTLLFPPIALVRLGRRILGIEGDGTGDIALPGKSLNSLLYALFSFERRLLQVIDLPIGVSLLIVARRPV